MSRSLEIPDLSLVVLIGASGSGKSTFARTHFRATEVLSSDFFRGLIADDENDQSATSDAFDSLHYIAAKRLAAGRLTVIDATNVRSEDRKNYISLARQYHCLAIAIALNLPERICHERNASRSDRAFGPHVVRNQASSLRRGLRGLEREGFRHVYVLSSPEEIANAQLVRRPLWNNKKDQHGPFDIIGDVHGCCDELEELLTLLGYESSDTWRHPSGRKAIFLGDLVDRGPRVLDAVSLVRGMVEAGSALCVPGNHDIKLMRKLRGKQVKVTHGLEQSLAELEQMPAEERGPFERKLADFLDSLVSHYILDDGKLVVAHAGLREELQGRGSGAVREFALYGETTGESDEFGLPIRYNWAAEYRGKAMMVYGHTPVPQTDWLNNTVNIDTGCVFGGRLTALRYPEREFVSVTARRAYAAPLRPLTPCTPTLTAQQQHDTMLDLDDVLGKLLIETRLHSRITIREENAIAALEVMSRFAIDPRWLIYLPPTMSPCQTSSLPDLLEHPSEAFEYYRKNGVGQVVCEEKHMGSRAVVIVCRDEEVPRARFGVEEKRLGVCYTRTGRPFFPEGSLEGELIARIHGALASSGFWEQLTTDWVCLDCELMPWSAKAQELLRSQYAAVGAAATHSLRASIDFLTGAATSPEIGGLIDATRARLEMVEKYRTSYRNYCWPVRTVDDLKLAPFHVLATEGHVHTDRDHLWHMRTIEEFLSGGAPLLTPTRHIAIDPAKPEAAVEWWEEITSKGGEGMVVKPLEFVARGKDILQPAVKCRGREYLRIIYGPEYTAPGQLDRLRARGLSGKRSLALREFALGIEALNRFVERQPLRRVHECVFGVLALESEPVDPRL